jgi:hypothetical protein
MPIICINLGMSNFAAAVLRSGRQIIIPSAEAITLGGKAFPRYVAARAYQERIPLSAYARRPIRIHQREPGIGGADISNEPKP